MSEDEAALWRTEWEQISEVARVLKERWDSLEPGEWYLEDCGSGWITYPQMVWEECYMPDEHLTGKCGCVRPAYRF